MDGLKRIIPQDGQVCVVETKNGDVQYAIWTTSYSIYGAGGHFQLGGGGMLGIPVDVAQWWGTHWLVNEQDGLAICGQTGRRAARKEGGE